MNTGQWSHLKESSRNQWIKPSRCSFSVWMKIYLTHGKNVQTKTSRSFGFSSHVYQEEAVSDPLVNKL